MKNSQETAHILQNKQNFTITAEHNIITTKKKIKEGASRMGIGLEARKN